MHERTAFANHPQEYFPRHFQPTRGSDHLDCLRRLIPSFLADRSLVRRFIGVSLLLLFFAACGRAQPVSHVPDNIAGHSIGRIPFYFEENLGQSVDAARFVASSGTTKALIANDGVIFSVGHQPVSMQIVGASRPVFRAENPVEGVSNYYLGPRSVAGLSHYSRIRANSIKPGVDIVYYGSGDELEYDFVVHPQTDPRALRLRFTGTRKPELQANGELVIGADREIRLRKPEASQEVSGQRRRVSCGYRVSESGEVSLIVGPYDRSRVLTIDPVISFSTFLSSSGNDSIQGVAVDPSGVYVVGTTYTKNFPVTAGTTQGNPGIFVTKFNLTGTALLYSTIIAGGSGNAIVADGSGNVYVTGTAGSDFSNTTIASGEHVFVSKLNSSGAMLYGTVLSGNVGEIGQAIAVDSMGAAYVAGITYSTSLPTTPGAIKTSLSGTTDAVVAKFTSTGQVAYATYLGGSGYDSATGIAVDGSGNAFVAGWTQSSDFPTTAGSYSTLFKGTQDAFVTIVNPAGTAILNSTLLGGSALNTATGITRDTTGAVYVTGTTNSSDFPATFTQGGTQGVFVAKFNAGLSTLIYSALIGTGNFPSNLQAAIAVDQFGGAYVSTTAVGVFGIVGVPSAPITAGGFDTGASGSMYFFQLPPAGNALSYAGRFGAGNEFATGVAIDGNGGVYISGYTTSSAFPTTGGSYQPIPTSKTTSGFPSGLLVKIDLTSPTSCVTALGPTPGTVSGGGGTFSLNFTIPAGCPWAVTADGQGETLTGQTAGVSIGASVPVNGTVPPNPNTAQRTLKIYVSEQNVAITQAPASCFQPGVSPSPLTLDAAGDPQNVSVVLPNVCDWTAVSNTSWLTLSNLPPSGFEAGSATPTISAPPFSYSQRTGTLTIANETFTVTQTGSGTCTASASASSPMLPNTGGTGEIRVSVSNGSCIWQGYSLVPWIQVAAASAEGSYSFPYVVSPNPGAVPRTGQILAADQLVTITQAAGPAGAVTSYTASVFAGGAVYQDGVPAISGGVGSPVSLFLDSQSGNFYFADNQLQKVRVIASNGTINTVGASLPITEATAVTADPAENVYIGDLGRVWSVTQNATFAGTGTYGFSGDNGPATSGQITLVAGLAADGSHVYISDQINARIRAVSGGIITTVAGGGTTVQSDGLPATQAELNGPRGIILDKNGNLVFGDGNAIRTVSGGIINTLPVTSGTLSLPQSLAYDVAGNLFIAEFGRTLVKMTPSGAVSPVALPSPVQALSVATDSAANLYVGDGVNHIVWKLAPVTSCTYSVTTPAVQAVPGGPVTVTVNTSAACNWTAVSDLPWVTITSGSSGTGSANVQLTFAPNTGPARIGTVAIAGQLILVSQMGVTPPAGISATPSSGSGSAQNFAFAFSDVAGASDILAARVVVNNSLSGTNACFMYYTSGGNMLYLLSDAGALQTGIPLGTAGTLSNSQCSINVGASSVVSSGTTLTLNLAIEFTPAFVGTKDIFLEAQNATLLGGWIQLGTWTVTPPSPPAAVSVTPNSGTGSSQVFAATFSDPAGASDILAARVLFNTSLASGVESCFVYYTAAGQTLYLLSDTGALQSGIPIGTPGTLSNSQCSVNAGSSSLVASGTTLTLNLAITFAPAFVGAKNIFLEAQNATALGPWGQLGTWNVPGGASAPTPLTLAPMSGTGYSVTFGALFSDAAGGSDVVAARLLINNLLSSANGCFVYYTNSGGANMLYLMTDAGAFQAGAAIGSSAILSNSQCSLNAGSSSVVISGNTFTLNVALTLTPAFAGTKSVFMEAQSNTVVGEWIDGGMWTVPNTSGPPIAVSVTPNAGSGNSQIFTATFSDGAGAADIAAARFLINTSLSGANACFVYYYNAGGANVIYLLSDAGAFQSPIQMGTPGTLSNSQCNLNVGASSANLSGTTLTLNLAITFAHVFEGAKNIFMEAQNSTTLGVWSALGTWGVL